MVTPWMTRPALLVTIHYRNTYQMVGSVQHCCLCTSIISKETSYRNGEFASMTLPTIRLPRRTLLVLCGPAASGKSTFAKRRFGETTIVSSDYCRALICDDAANQQVNRDAFDLFYYIIRKRMFLGRFTVADSTALYSDARRRLREMARMQGYLACLLIFNMPASTCLQWDRQRERVVGEAVVDYHARLLQQTLIDVPGEGWDQTYLLGEADMDAQIEVEL
jgi:predicted kinase